MRKAIMAAVDSASFFSSDHPSLNKQVPPLSNEARISQITPSHFRHPLQSRDNNVKMRAPPPPEAPLATKSSNRKMVQNNKQQATSRPLMPNISVSAKSSNSKPLTPRVAGSISQSRTVVLSQQGAFSPAVRVNSSEDLSISSLFNYNVTPRSGSRKSRLNSAGSTPSSTPTGTPEPSYSNDSSWHVPSVPVVSSYLAKSDRDSSKRPLLSARPLSDLGSTKSTLGTTRGEKKFVFADEVKTAQSKPQAKAKNSSTFFYANGDTSPSSPQHSLFSNLDSTTTEERSSPKFFHANGAPDFSPLPIGYHPPPRPGSALSFTSQMSHTIPGNQSANKSMVSSQVGTSSPSRLNQEAQTPLPSLFENDIRRKQTSAGPSNTIIDSRKSNENKQFLISGHGRSTSCDTAGLSLPFSKKLFVENLIDPNFNPPRVPAASISTPEIVTDKKPISEPQSPVKIGNSHDQLNELAANARRERKVLDLEITNSSLAAINKTLEREMRKQSAELRRYKRLSRSGNLSIATSPLIHRTSLSDMSEDDSGEQNTSEENPDLTDEEASEDDSRSPHAIAESDLRHRTKDEKKLRQDLAKHQQLLIDSQKMNQTLKRCLCLTEELIGGGRKALQYKVAVTDVELGGRVLVSDESQEYDNEGMSEVGLQMLKEARLAALNERASRVSISKLDQGNEVYISQVREQIGAAGQLLS